MPQGLITICSNSNSAAVAGPANEYSTSIKDDTQHHPRTHYGVFKLANEGSAKIYWSEKLEA
jgi:hypothetical protein